MDFLFGCSTSLLHAARPHAVVKEIRKFWSGDRVSSLRAQAGVRGEVKTCAVVFLGGHFLFTRSDTFAVGCIV